MLFRSDALNKALVSVKELALQEFIESVTTPEPEVEKPVEDQKEEE